MTFDETLALLEEVCSLFNAFNVSINPSTRLAHSLLISQMHCYLHLIYYSRVHYISMEYLLDLDRFLFCNCCIHESIKW